MLLAFAPFIAFFILVRLATPLAGLVAAAIVSLALCGRMLLRHEAVKILEIGSFILFAALALGTLVFDWSWTLATVRLAVDTGLLAIVLASLAIGRPFTLQYARERVSAEFWDTPTFKATNRVITGVWAAAFAVLIAADLVAAYVPSIPVRLAVWVSVAALVGAFWFTGWYPEVVRHRASPPARQP